MDYLETILIQSGIEEHTYYQQFIIFSNMKNGICIDLVKTINLKSKKKINIKILTRNTFKKRRVIKFYYSNNDFIMYDFDKKYISSANIFIIKLIV